MGLTVCYALELGTDNAAVDAETVATFSERCEYVVAVAVAVAVIERERLRGVAPRVDGDDGAGFAVVAFERTVPAVGVVAAKGEERCLVFGGEGTEFVFVLVLRVFA